VETDTFLFSQPGDIYGLTIDNLHKTELCNIHINKGFFDGAVNAMARGSEQLLDDPFDAGNTQVPLFTQLYRKDDRFNSLADKLTQPETYNTNSFEAVLAELIEHIVMQNTGIRNNIERLPFAKASVRAEIYHRLSVAKDYIHSNYQSPIELDEVCREIGMSKFHFLRVFKACYGISPYQFLSDVRMEKARAMLQHTNASIADIGANLGYEFSNSFIKAFRKTYQVAPLQYRNSKISNFG
jgi:AraC family transcriptional regulator